MLWKFLFYGRTIMKKNIFMIVLGFAVLGAAIGLAACKDKCKDIELMGAGDRIHDSYTFANTGVGLTDMGNNKFEITGSIEYLSDSAVKTEFKIPEDVSHVVAIKLTNCSGVNIVKEEVKVEVNGTRNYDAEHLNGSNYTFIILEAKVGATTTISVKWNKDAEPMVYTIKMSDNLVLKENA